MMLATKLKSALNALTQHFNIFATNLPSGEIRAEMEKEGWEFSLIYHPYRASISMEFAITPEGRPALGMHASNEDRQRLKDTISTKKGLLPA